MSIKLNGRTRIVQNARMESWSALIKIVRKHKLTALEVASVLTQELATWVDIGLRGERHPDDPEKKADEA